MSTFVSYAQNFEDVILRRALGGIEGGFYVDVGAQHPLKDSVTRAFYERGWRGINIEPVQGWFDLLKLDRPEDINVRAAIGKEEGHIEFYDVDGTGLSTSDAETASRHARDGFLVRLIRVPTMKLDQVLEQYVDGEIHFLKIDVEGGEADVLSSFSLEKWRPWIIVVEATRPNTQESSTEEWAGAVLSAGYTQVYHDGLNCFFLANEHSDLTKYFRYPPNFFDNFVRHSDWERAEEARRLRIEIESYDARIEDLSSREASALETIVRKSGEVEALSRELKDEKQAAMRQANLFAEQQEKNRQQQEAYEQQQEEYERQQEEYERQQEEYERQQEEYERQQATLMAEHRTAHEQRSRQALTRLSAEYEAKLSESRAFAEDMHARLHSLQQRMDLLISSRSWRLTRPLRWLSLFVGADKPYPQDSSVDHAGGQIAVRNTMQIPTLTALEPVPDVSRLLALASQLPETEAAQVREPPTGSDNDRLDALLSELSTLSLPSSSLPPKLEKMPGAAVVRSPVLRLYERLFRKQALVNSKMIEAIRILREHQRGR